MGAPPELQDREVLPDGHLDHPPPGEIFGGRFDVRHFEPHVADGHPGARIA